jgi:hypothetical protein
MAKGAFRHDDPFLKDRALAYKHIGFTKQVTWLYQDVLLVAVVLLILALQCWKRYYKTRGGAGVNNWTSKSVQRWLFSDAPGWNDYFQSNMNFMIIGGLYAVNTFVALVNLPMDDSFNLALRFGLVAISNIPILYLLPLKASVFSLGLSYENLIIYHKAIGVLVLVTSLIHTGAFVYCLNWQYLFTNNKSLTGFYMILAFLLIGIASITFIRRNAYEVFYAVHLLASYSFLPVCYRHHYVCKPFVIMVTVSLIVDKLVKLSKTRFTSCTVRSSSTNKSDLIIEIKKPSNFNWNCSNHLYINIPRISLYQTHPLTIANLPNDDKILLIVKINKGFTKRLFEKSLTQKEFSCVIHGPYGISHTHIHMSEESSKTSRYSISEESELVETPLISNSIEHNSSKAKSVAAGGMKEELQVNYGSISSSLSTSSASIPDYKNNIGISSPDQSGIERPGVISKNDLKGKYVLISAGSGITFILPILLKFLEFEKSQNDKNELNHKNMTQGSSRTRDGFKLDFKFIWILRDDSIMDLLPAEIKTMLNFQGSSDNREVGYNDRVQIWYTSKHGRPDLDELLYSSTTNENNNTLGEHLKIFACGPEGFISGVKRFGVEKLCNIGHGDVDLILEQFSF